MRTCAMCEADIPEPEGGGRVPRFRAMTQPPAGPAPRTTNFQIRYPTPDNPNTKGYICTDCDAGNALHWCPECGPYVEEGWSDYRLIQPVPCPEHSLSDAGPVVECSACGVEIMLVDDLYDRYGVSQYYYYCGGCAGQGRMFRCAAPNCQEVFHRDEEDVYRTWPGGRTCLDCGKPGPHPRQLNPFRPQEWDFDPGCGCRLCSWLQDYDPERYPPPPEAAREPPRLPCSSCDYRVHLNNLTTIERGVRYCHSCKRGNLTTCTECERERPRGAFIQTPRPGNLCRSCAEELGFWHCDFQCDAWFPEDAQCGCGGVHGYNYTPPAYQFQVADGESGLNLDKTPFLGIELEVEALAGGSRSEGAKIVHDIPWAYPVHDGTLVGNRPNGLGGDGGFEIVTHPMSWRWFNEHWPEIEGLLATLSTRGYRSWESGRCGMHVHVSRRPMSESHGMRFIRFIYGSPNLCMTVGQRSAKNPALREYAPFDQEDPARFIEKIRDYRNPGVDGHYCALNAAKRVSLEARWFRGTLNPESFRKNVEFIHSVWYFTKREGHRSANEINYIEWLRTPPERGQYATLLDYLEKNYVTRR